jgi:hypothetical protein
MNDEREQIEAANVWAWMGLDDGNPPTEPGIVGIKQGRTPAGNIPLASIRAGQMMQPYIVEQMQALATITRKRRFLVRFKFDAIVEVLE